MFKELAPYVITATVIICAVIAIKIKKEDILTTDGIFAVVGFALGLFITSLNLIYSNNYLISLGPLLAIACLLYLRFRDRILTSSTDFNINLSSKTLKIKGIILFQKETTQDFRIFILYEIIVFLVSKNKEDV